MPDAQDSGRAFVHMARYWLGREEAYSQTSMKERATLTRFAAAASRGVEIGVYEGVTACLIGGALATNQGILYAIDPFIPGRLGICWSQWIARTQIRREGLRNTIRLIRKYSYEACALIDGTFDFIFIDGDHSYEGISRDWNDWSGRVSKGGILALHDVLVPFYNPSVAGLGTRRFYDERVRIDRRFEIVEEVDSLSVLRKSG